MKNLRLTLSTLIVTAILMFGCKKETSTPPINNNNNNNTPALMDTTVNVDFVIQAPGQPWTNIAISSIGFDSNNQYYDGSNYNVAISGNVNYYSAGDTSHINKCSAPIFINKSMLFSKTIVAHFEIEIVQSGGFINAQFDYDPLLRKFTSFIYPVNGNPVGQNSVHPILVANTGYSLNCKSGKWVIYCKF